MVDLCIERDGHHVVFQLIVQVLQKLGSKLV
jgi:hypothetical protein